MGRCERNVMSCSREVVGPPNKRRLRASWQRERPLAVGDSEQARWESDKIRVGHHKTKVGGHNGT